MDALVTTEWLGNELGNPDLRVVDATYVDAATGRDAAAEFADGHIPGAVFLDLAELRDTDDDLPNTVPGAAKFASRVGALGLGDGCRIVLYDESPVRTSARAWFLFRHFGAREVALLDGGIAKWRTEGRPLATGTEPPRPRHFTVQDGPAALRSLDDMRANLASAAEQVLDARSTARFSGAEADPRPGVAPGHIPGARNLPYPRLFESDGTWKRGDALRAAFVEAGIDLDRPVATTCGSGVTAAILLFGLHLLGRGGALYDGSWSEWGADPAVPKAVGAT